MMMAMMMMMMVMMIYGLALVLAQVIWFILTLILLMWRIWQALNNASKWQIGFNSAFKGLITNQSVSFVVYLTTPFKILAL
jgi:hypothetical protein